MAVGFQKALLERCGRTLAVCVAVVHIGTMATNAQVIEDAIPQRNPAAGRTAGSTRAGNGGGTSAGMTADEIRQCIRDLGNARFELREQATRRLEHAGVAAVEPLVTAIENADGLETITRAIRGLQGILDFGDDAAFDAAEIELERLAESRNTSIARRAASALTGQSFSRRRRSVARIRALGGIVYVVPDERESINQPVPVVADDEENLARGLRIILSSDWKAGDAGLINLRRLGTPPQFVYSQVYITDSSGVSKDAVLELQKAMPGLNVQERGGAMLGVSFPAQANCVVGTVHPDSGADRAGLREGDLITTYDGEKLRDFEHLTTITRRHRPGDKVILEIVREKKPLTVEVELTGWK